MNLAEFTAIATVTVWLLAISWAFAAPANDLAPVQSLLHAAYFDICLSSAGDGPTAKKLVSQDIAWKHYPSPADTEWVQERMTWVTAVGPISVIAGVHKGYDERFLRRLNICAVVGRGQQDQADAMLLHLGGHPTNNAEGGTEKSYLVDLGGNIIEAWTFEEDGTVVIQLIDVPDQ